jgi:apolipoprotein D and lipocalin family protein
MQEPIDLEQYMGKWYEIRRSDNPFQRKCISGTTTATYTLLDDKKTVKVENVCETVSGQTIAVGTAWMSGPRTLSITFLPFVPFLPRVLAHVFSSSYIIKYVSHDYKYAVVRSGKLWWILSKEKNVTQSNLKDLLKKVP